MKLPMLLHLQPEDKLEALRRLDLARHWHSLDDRRFCRRCQRTITGRQIEVVVRATPRGELGLRCSTDRCEATPVDWTYVDPFAAAAGLPAGVALDSADDGTGFGGEITTKKDGQVCTVRRPKHRSKDLDGSSSPDRSGAILRRLSSLRGHAARLPLLRPLASSHVFQPVV